MNDADFAWKLLIVLASVGGAAAAVVSIWARTAGRRFPPLTEELVKVYATKEELKAAITAIECRCAEERASRARIYAEINALRKDMFEELKSVQGEVSKSFAAIERSLGRLESRPDAGGRPT